MAAIFHFYYNSAPRKIRIAYKNTYDTNMTEILENRLNTFIYLSLQLMIYKVSQKKHPRSFSYNS